MLELLNGGDMDGGRFRLGPFFGLWSPVWRKTPDMKGILSSLSAMLPDCPITPAFCLLHKIPTSVVPFASSFFSLPLHVSSVDKRKRFSAAVVVPIILFYCHLKMFWAILNLHWRVKGRGMWMEWDKEASYETLICWAGDMFLCCKFYVTWYWKLPF